MRRWKTRELMGPQRARQINYLLNPSLVPYVVKRIYGRLYVYRQFRVGPRVVTEYIGPLDKIVESYISKKSMGPGGLEPPTPGLEGRCFRRPVQALSIRAELRAPA